MSKERFKVSIHDRVTGEKIIFYSDSPGYQFRMVKVQNQTTIARIVLDHPRTKIKGNKK